MKQADVIIIGGGIMGASAAFFLRRLGKSVILLERNLVGQQASGTNFGNVRRQGRHISQLPLANRARDIWGRLNELIGDDCEFIATGHLRICYSRKQADKVECYAQEANPYGLDLEIISANVLRNRFPFIGREAILGCYAPHDGHANPRITTPAFARAAVRIGAHLEENTEVTAIEKKGDDFQVETQNRGTFTGPVVLVTAGAWGGALAARFGEVVPFEVHGPQMAVTEPVPYRIVPVIGVSTPLVAETVYCRQVTRGNIVIGGGTRGPALLKEVRSYVDPQNTIAQMAQICRVVPAFEKLNVIRVWSGIESYVADDLPIMGASAKISGLFYAFGFCGAGFQIGPGVGDVMAELIATGTTSTPINPYHISRFQTKTENKEALS